MKDIKRAAARAIIGQRIAQARQMAAMSQEDLAIALLVSRSLIASIETGRSRLFADQLYQIARLTKRPMEDFVR